MFTFKQKVSPTITIAIALFIIFSWTLCLSDSELLLEQGVIYYLVIAAVGSCLAAYALVVGILEIIQLAKKHE